jgi:hypothetical protein
VTSIDIARVVSLLKDAMTGIAAVTAAVVAAKGLQTWKRQLHGNTNYELARRLLRSVYKLREAIRWLRRTYISAGEMSAAIKAAGPDAPSQGSLDHHRRVELAYQARWQSLVDAQVEFAAELLEAEALWGPEIRERGEALAPIVVELHACLDQWLSRHEQPFDSDRKEIMDVIYEAGEISNKFSAKLLTASRR